MARRAAVVETRLDPKGRPGQVGGIMTHRSPSPDLSHIDTWIFDLDNTLYPASDALFAQIDRKMKAFISARLGLGLDDAHALQKHYYRTYGTTLRGLMTKHAVDPHEFLHYVHDIDHSVLRASPALDHALSRLKGRKLVFTNGSRDHALKVLGRLHIAAHFDAVFDIADAQFIPKPDPAAYALMVEMFGIDPSRAVMIEDLERNLLPARQMGMTTVWVRQQDHPDDIHDGPFEGDLPPHVDIVTESLVHWLEIIANGG